MYRPSTSRATAPAQPASAARPAARTQHPGPEVGDPGRRQHPRLGLVEDLATEQRGVTLATVGPSTAATRSGSPRPQSIAKGIPQTLPDGVVSGVLKSPWASNQAIASGRSVAPRASPAIAPACAVQSPPSTSQARRRGRGTGADRRRDQVALARQERAIAARFLARGSGSGANPGSMARSPASPPRPPARPGRAASAVDASPARAARPAFASIPDKVATQRGRDTDDDDRIRSWPPWCPMMSACASPSSPSSATSRAGSSRPSTCCARRTSRATRWPSCSPSPTTRRAALWDGLAPRLHRIDRPPAPARARSRRCTTRIEPDEVLTFAGAEEAVFCLMNVLLGPGDHAIVTWPGYQSLYEVARAGGADVTPPRAAANPRAGRSTSTCCGAQVTPQTRLIVVNAPHNPTGMLPGPGHLRRPRGDRRRGGRAICSWTRSTAASSSTRRIVCRPAPMRSRRGISLGVMSKSFAMAGLRIGWLASHDRDLLARVAAFKDYTTICSSGAVGDPGDHRAACAARRCSRARGRSSPPTSTGSTRSSRTGRTASAGSARGRARSASRG